MADATIDPNANANHRDIRSFMTEKGKSEDKLFGLNKIFLEIKKKWGLRTAKAWLEQEFSKGFYLNDRVSVLGKIGYISGFASGSAYVKDRNDNYITLPDKSYCQVGFSNLQLLCHNNNWQFIQN